MNVTETISQMLLREAPYQKNRTESEGRVRVINHVEKITENNVRHALTSVKARNRRIREPYVRWCERTGREIIPTFLLDFRQKVTLIEL
jgi:hypothetical protein